jgi:hypothetical protein
VTRDAERAWRHGEEFSGGALENPQLPAATLVTGLPAPARPSTMRAHERRARPRGHPGPHPRRHAGARSVPVLSLYPVAISLAEAERSPSAAAVVLEALYEVRAELDLSALGDDGALQRQLDAGLAHGIKRAPRLGEKAPEGSLEARALGPMRFNPPGEDKKHARASGSVRAAARSWTVLANQAPCELASRIEVHTRRLARQPGTRGWKRALGPPRRGLGRAARGRRQAARSSDLRGDRDVVTARARDRAQPPGGTRRARPAPPLPPWPAAASLPLPPAPPRHHRP